MSDSGCTAIQYHGESTASFSGLDASSFAIFLAVAVLSDMAVVNDG